MASATPSASPPDARPPRRKKKFKWRPALRAVHRDIGYLAVGLTLVYALSGIAVNHIADWNPNFTTLDAVHEIDGIPTEEQAAATYVAGKLGIDEAPTDVFAFSEKRIVVSYENRTLNIDPTTGRVSDKGQEPRFLIRVMNWLHLNRGKKAWTYFADGYAVMLILLAVSGMFMLPGKRGLIGRGGVLVIIGVALPILYVHYSGGP